ncbi:unnamed protein product [Psylliodes chrysocephalus]|uniref:Uncharacterized protein n=1 Tax=Psylliodes chrysocephalus TaxID=3402493 RepID=A0A9P0DAD3_9CUCU|nr:unnamed protein product [Psylliodes chrysocephala]
MNLEDTLDKEGTEDDNDLNEGELSIGNITSIASQIKGLEEMDIEKIQEWIECDYEEKGYQIMDDDENNCVIKTSHREPGDAVNVLVQYFEEEPGNDDIYVLQLRKVKEILKCRSYESQKQTKISDFFK